MSARLTYAGRPFRMPSPKILGLMDRYAPLEHLRELTPPRPALSKNLLGLAPPDWPHFTPRLNDLWYPTGATRWAWFRGLMTRQDLERVAAVVYAGGAATAAPLACEANGVGITTDLHMLPPRPLAELGGGAADDGLYLVTLVDDRYHWRLAGAGSITCTSGTSTWAGLISTLGTALGVTISHTSVESAYGVPEPDSPLYSHHESPAALLDAVADDLGRVLVRNLDGTYALVRWSAANAVASAADLGAAGSGTAGGVVLPHDPLTSAPARALVTPATIRVSFPKWNDGVGYRVPSPNYRGWQPASYHETHSVQVSASGLGSPYSALPTRSGEFALRTTAKARYTLPADSSPNNSSALTALAERLAKDTYDRLTGGADVSVAGVVAADPGWGHDILWSWAKESGGKTHTRLTRLPWDRLPADFRHGFAPLESAPGCGMKIDDTGRLVVDLDAIAGSGITVGTVGDCQVLQVVGGGSVTLGCHLALDGDDRVEVTPATLAGDGLEVDDDADPETCDPLKVKEHCHINVSSDGVAVDTTTLVGTASATALKVATGGGCAPIQVDMTRDATKDVAYYVDTVADLAVAAGGEISLTYNRRLVTHHHNAAGLHVKTILGDPEAREEVADVCDAGCYDTISFGSSVLPCVAGSRVVVTGGVHEPEVHTPRVVVTGGGEFSFDDAE